MGYKGTEEDRQQRRDIEEKRKEMKTINRKEVKIEEKRKR